MSMLDIASADVPEIKIHLIYFTHNFYHFPCLNNWMRIYNSDGTGLSRRSSWECRPTSSERWNQIQPEKNITAEEMHQEETGLQTQESRRWQTGQSRMATIIQPDESPREGARRSIQRVRMFILVLSKANPCIRKCTRDIAPKEESVSMACYTGNIPTVLDRSQYINQWLEEVYPTPQPNRWIWICACQLWLSDEVWWKWR